MGITVDDFNKLVDKAKEKEDGVYSMKPYTYAVKDGKFLGFCDYRGYMYVSLGSFITNVGRVEYRFNQKKELKRYFEIK